MVYFYSRHLLVLVSVGFSLVAPNWAHGGVEDEQINSKAGQSTPKAGPSNSLKRPAQKDDPAEDRSAKIQKTEDLSQNLLLQDLPLEIQAAIVGKLDDAKDIEALEGTCQDFKALISGVPELDTRKKCLQVLGFFKPIFGNDFLQEFVEGAEINELGCIKIEGIRPSFCQDSEGKYLDMQFLVEGLNPEANDYALPQKNAEHYKKLGQDFGQFFSRIAGMAMEKKGKENLEKALEKTIQNPADESQAWPVLAFFQTDLLKDRVPESSGTDSNGQAWSFSEAEWQEAWQGCFGAFSQGFLSKFSYSAVPFFCDPQARGYHTADYLPIQLFDVRDVSEKFLKAIFTRPKNSTFQPDSGFSGSDVLFVQHIGGVQNLIKKIIAENADDLSPTETAVKSLMGAEGFYQKIVCDIQPSAGHAGTVLFFQKNAAGHWENGQENLMGDFTSLADEES